MAYLVSQKNKQFSGNIYQAQNEQVAKLRWQRSSGLLLRADETMTPGAVLKHRQQLDSFEKPDYPSGPQDFLGLVEKGKNVPPSSGDAISFKGRAVLVTGAGSG